MLESSNRLIKIDLKAVFMFKTLTLSYTNILYFSVVLLEFRKQGLSCEGAGLIQETIDLGK